jgi:hypothetical protein
MVLDFYERCRSNQRNRRFAPLGLAIMEGGLYRYLRTRYIEFGMHTAKAAIAPIVLSMTSNCSPTNKGDIWHEEMAGQLM